MLSNKHPNFHQRRIDPFKQVARFNLNTWLKTHSIPKHTIQTKYHVERIWHTQYILAWEGKHSQDLVGIACKYLTIENAFTTKTSLCFALQGFISISN